MNRVAENGKIAGYSTDRNDRIDNREIAERAF